MQNLVGIYRTKEDLQRALVELEKLKALAAKAAWKAPSLQSRLAPLLRSESHVHVSEAVTHSALARTESRGAHSRIDYPNLDTVWEKKQHHCPGIRRMNAANRR